MCAGVQAGRNKASTVQFNRIVRCAMHLIQIRHATFASTPDSIRTHRADTCMTTPVPSRRRFIVNVALAAVAVPLVMRTSGEARAAALVKLPLANPQAKALGYVEDASTTKNPV